MTYSNKRIFAELKKKEKRMKRKHRLENLEFANKMGNLQFDPTFATMLHKEDTECETTKNHDIAYSLPTKELYYVPGACNEIL